MPPDAVPPSLRAWFRSAYPTLTFDDHWLAGCCHYLQTSFPGVDVRTLIKKTENQLLLSDLADSLSPVHSPTSHFPPRISASQDFASQPPTFHLTFSPSDDLDRPEEDAPAEASGSGSGKKKSKGVLVQVINLEEIGHSAWSQSQSLSSRLEGRRLSLLKSSRSENQPSSSTGPGIVRLADLDLDEDDENAKTQAEGKFARAMLKLKLSDGTTAVNALEIERIPALELGETPLGAKIFLHPPITVRRGFLLLTPDNVTFKGGKIDALDAGSLQDSGEQDDEGKRVEGAGREEAIRRSLVDRLGSDPFVKFKPPALASSSTTAAKLKPSSTVEPAPPPTTAKPKKAAEPVQLVDEVVDLDDDMDDFDPDLLIPPPLGPKASSSRGSGAAREMDEFDVALMDGPEVEDLTVPTASRPKRTPKFDGGSGQVKPGVGSKRKEEAKGKPEVKKRKKEEPEVIELSD